MPGVDLNFYLNSLGLIILNISHLRNIGWEPILLHLPTC